MTGKKMMNEVKHPKPIKRIPQRTCVICKTKDAKRELMRVVRTAGGVIVDASGKAHGRGAYLCDSVVCWQRALAGDTLGKALKTTLTGDDRQRLEQAMPKR